MVYQAKYVRSCRHGDLHPIIAAAKRPHVDRRRNPDHRIFSLELQLTLVWTYHLRDTFGQDYPPDPFQTIRDLRVAAMPAP